QTVVSTALPRIAADLKGFSQLSWVVTAYLLTSTATVPLYGKLSDLYGRRALFVVSISIFVLGSCLCAVATDIVQLAAFRAVQGLDAGGRPLLATRTRPLPGLHRLRLGGCLGRRAAARRAPDRPGVLAVDLLDQHPARRARALRHLDGDARPVRAPRPRDRLRRRRNADDGGDVPAARRRLGRIDLCLVVAAGTRGRRGEPRLLRRLRRFRAACDGAAASVPSLPDPHLRDRERRDPLPGRDALLGADLRAALRAGR